MNEPSSRTFLDVRSYRRKRLVDAAKLLPMLGAAALLFPIPFLFRAPDEGGPGGALSLALFLFGVWLALILAAFLLSRHLHAPGEGG